MFILRSLRYWLTLVLLAVVVVAFLVVWLYVSPTLEGGLIKQKLETLRRNTSLVQAAVAVDTSDGLASRQTREMLRYQSVVVDGRIDARVVILDSTARQVLADSRPGLKLSLRDYPLAARTTLSGTTELGIVTVDEIDYAAAASVMSLSPIPAGGPPRESAVVLLIASLDEVKASVGVVRERLALATGLALGVAALVGFIVAAAIARRLRSIEQESQVIANGDFSASVQVRVRDEIGQLAEGFNRMGRRLNDAFHQMQRQRKRVEVLLDTLEEGVIGIDANGRVTIANQAAERVLGASLQERLLPESVVPNELEAIWRRCRVDRQSHSAVFDHSGRTLEAMVYPIYPVDTDANTHSAITLRDVSAAVRLEKARKDFLANASHELKTPLFSLAGFLDILAEERVDAAGRRRFLGLMQKQVARMRRLAIALLDLSRIEAGSVELHPCVADPSSVVAGVLSEFEGRAASRHIDLQLNTAGAPGSAFFDTGRLEQIIRVLADNALKFSPDEGTVGVRVARENGWLAVRVSDNGPAIPQSDLERVFDRFYSGDSDQSEGSSLGLGLAIARELAELMGGSLEALDTRGSGAELLLRLPLSRD